MKLKYINDLKNIKINNLKVNNLKISIRLFDVLNINIILFI